MYRAWWRVCCAFRYGYTFRIHCVSSNPTHVGCTPDTTLCDKVCQCRAEGRLFSPDTPVSFTNKTDRHDITEILFNVASSTMTLTPKWYFVHLCSFCFVGFNVLFMLFVFYLHILVPYDFYIWCCSCHLTVAQRVPLLEHELLTLRDIQFQTRLLLWFVLFNLLLAFYVVFWRMMFLKAYCLPKP